MTDDFDSRWVTERSIRIVLGAVDGDADSVAQALEEVAERYGHHGVYCVCCSLAEAVVRMAGYERAEDGFWGFEVEHLDRGVINPDEAGEGARNVVQAMRFITAWLNNDTAQRVALFDAGLTPEDAMSIPAGLITLVGIWGRHKLRESAS